MFLTFSPALSQARSHGPTNTWGEVQITQHIPLCPLLYVPLELCGLFSFTPLHLPSFKVQLCCHTLQEDFLFW